MGKTANYNLPFPEATDKANVPLDIQKLAEAAEAALKNKVNSEIGKRLMTNTEGEKLASLENYDDTELNEKIEEQAEQIAQLEKEKNQLLKDHKPIPFNSSSNHLEDTGELPMPISINGGIEQDTRQGYNKIKVLEKTGTKNGIDYVASNGTVTVNGTATKDTYLYEMFEFEDYEAGDYFVSGCPSGGDTTKYNFGVDGISGSSDFGTGKQISVSEAVSKRAVIIVRNGATVSNLVFEPMVTSGTTQKEFEQYGAMPSKEFPSEVKGVCGHYDNIVENKNIFNKNGKFTNGYLVMGEVVTSSSWKVTDFIPIPDDVSTLTVLNGWGKSEVHSFYDEKKKEVYSYSMGNNTSAKIPVKDNYKYLRATVQSTNYDNFMLAFGDTDTFIEHQEQNYSIDIPVGQVWYSGKPYKENGKWYRPIEYGKDYIEPKFLVGNPTYRFIYTDTKFAKYDTANIGYSNIGNLIGSGTGEVEVPNIWLQPENNRINIVWNSKDAPNPETLNTKLQALIDSGTQPYFVTKLATPIKEEITDTTLIAQLEALEKAHSYYEVTNINSYRPTEDVAEMKLSGNALMSNDIRLSKLESAVLSIGGNV